MLYAPAHPLATWLAVYPALLRSLVLGHARGLSTIDSTIYMPSQLRVWRPQRRSPRHRERQLQTASTESTTDSCKTRDTCLDGGTKMESNPEWRISTR